MKVPVRHFAALGITAAGCANNGDGDDVTVPDDEGSGMSLVGDV